MMNSTSTRPATPARRSAGGYRGSGWWSPPAGSSTASTLNLWLPADESAPAGPIPGRTTPRPSYLLTSSALPRSTGGNPTSTSTGGTTTSNRGPGTIGPAPLDRSTDCGDAGGGSTTQIAGCSTGPGGTAAAPAVARRAPAITTGRSPAGRRPDRAGGHSGGTRGGPDGPADHHEVKPRRHHTAPDSARPGRPRAHQHVEHGVLPEKVLFQEMP